MLRPQGGRGNGRQRRAADFEACVRWTDKVRAQGRAQTKRRRGEKVEAQGGGGSVARGWGPGSWGWGLLWPADLGAGTGRPGGRGELRWVSKTKAERRPRLVPNQGNEGNGGLRALGEQSERGSRGGVGWGSLWV